MNIQNNFSVPNIKKGRKCADHRATLKCPECPGCREVVVMGATKWFWQHIITPQGPTIPSKISWKKHQGDWGRGSQQMCRSLWINFFLSCSLWSFHFIGVLRYPRGALPSCGVGTINILSSHHLQRVQIVRSLVQPFLSWDSLISQTSEFFSIAFGRDLMGYSPTLKNEALQGLESLYDGRWGGEGRSSRSEWTEVWYETGL